jgi:hypothetical protein
MIMNSDNSSGNITQHVTRRAPAVRRGLQEEEDDGYDDRPTSMSSSRNSAASLTRSSFPFCSSTPSPSSHSADVPTYASFMGMTKPSDGGRNNVLYSNNNIGYTSYKRHSSTASVTSTCSSTTETTATTTTTAYKSTPLPPGFQPGPYDVICARGKQVRTER